MTRRGRGGAIRENAGGFVAAAFPHRTSRAQDPHLHTHVVVANVAQSPDGTWRALMACRSCRPTGSRPATSTRPTCASELARELGDLDADRHRPGRARHRPVRGGGGVLAAPAQLVEHLEQTGGAGWHAAQAAAVITRARKEPLELARLTREWRARAAEHGLDRAALNRVFDVPGWQQPSTETIREIAAELVGPEGLTARRTSFTRADAIMAIAERLPDGAPPAASSSWRTLCSRAGAITRLDDATPGRPAPYTTSELIVAEHDLVEAAARIAATSSRAVQPIVVERIIDGDTRRHGLASEQADAVRTLTTAQGSLNVLVGAAGSGKTSSLAAVAAAFDYAGYTMIGAAPSAVAAQQLEHATGIPSTTLHRLADQTRRRPLARRTCLVIDEAGMADTRTLLRVLHAAEHASTRVLLVGDPEQLSAVGPGGALASIIDQHGATYLTETHRQRDPAERAALGRLRDGDAASYLTHAATTARLHITDTIEEATTSVVRAWWTEGRDNPAENLMIALRRSDVDALNHQARDRMQRSGRLGAEITTRSGLPLAVGDRIVLRRNDHAHRLTNGTRATITSVDPRHGVTIQTDQKQTRSVPRDYLDAGHLQHGYAITGHQAQGTTVERAYVLAPEPAASRSGATSPSAAPVQKPTSRSPARTSRPPTPPNDSADSSTTSRPSAAKRWPATAARSDEA